MAIAMLLLGVSFLCVSDVANGKILSRFKYATTLLGEAIDKASMKMLKGVYDSNIDKNVVCSPVSVLLLLSLYASGTAEHGRLRQEILNALGSSDYSEILTDYVSISDRFKSMDPSFLNLANKLYVADKYHIDSQFSEVAQKYHSEVETINFENVKSAADLINKWASEKTRGHIQNAVAANFLTPDTALALFNAVFFQGNWSSPFSESDTKVKEFYVTEQNNTVIKKTTMHLEKPLPYHDSSTSLGARLLELPYVQKDFRMVLVLPNEVDGLPELMAKAEAGILNEVSLLSEEELEGRSVILDLPKFEINTDLDLKNIFPKMGVASLFSERVPGIVANSLVTASSATQSVYLKVEENGSTAAAASGVAVVAGASLDESPPVIFTVDRPFMFLILHQDVTLFAGTYTH